MTDDDTPFDDADGRPDYGRVLVVLLALLGVVLASTAVPALSPQGTTTPAEELVPQPPDVGDAGGAGSGAGSGGGGLGALNPGSQTDVGGDLGGENAMRSQSAETHFVVRSTSASYWRTGAYDVYEGDGWAQSGEPTPADGDLGVADGRGEEVHYRVQLNRTATALPTVWRPSRVSRNDVLVTDGGAVRAEAALPGGTAYDGVSYAPRRDPDALRTAGTDYPEEVRERYTRLPASTDGRLKPFTDQLTDDADSPYETARTVESWLEEEKNYSLEVDEPGGDDVAGQFVFDMEAGYCEYFATSMVAMLRTQDVPARYVVGYSTGERTGEDTYTVRGMNAHAWVEVYFPDRGWVRFDPTPGQERLEQERESFREQRSGDYEATETGSPGEEFSTNGSDADGTPGENGSDGDGEPDGSTDGGDGSSGDATDDGDRERTVGEYTVGLNRSAAPGAPVTVTVTRNGLPVGGAMVTFNGEPVGVTDQDGQVVGEVPYAESLRVDVDGDAVLRADADGDTEGTPDGVELFDVAAAGGPAADRFYAAGQAGANATFDVATNATLAVDGDAVTGGEVTVTATVDGVPVRRAAVLVDGERVGETDDEGAATVALPDETGDVTVRVERGPVAGERTLTLAALNVSATPTAPVALPGTGVVVEATLGDDPVAGATVTVAGERVGETNVDGRTTARLPLANAARIAVDAHGQRAEQTVGGLFVNLAGTLLAALAVLGGAVLLTRRYGIDPATVRRALRRVPDLIATALVALGAVADRAVARLWARALLTADHLRSMVAGRRSPGDLLDALRDWLAARRAEVRSAAAGATAAAVGDDGPEGSHATVREAWAEFLDAVSLRRPGTRTPAAIGSHAVERDDLPSDAVWTLVDAFRAVEYGDRDPDERVPEVREAVAEVRRTVERREGGEDATGRTAGDADGVDDSPAGADAGVAD
ncbi:transglutaminase domain-containing protein [Halomicrobium salinisoli]|uniref:transglutaminase family protein n=1 Tax=Halomicrobium salinisoli TaxID=2878391 RepID=UPI001CF04A2D|nr:transglutaminase domain-containing protein [Halomicrobium salinisoli]